MELDGLLYRSQHLGYLAWLHQVKHQSKLSQLWLHSFKAEKQIGQQQGQKLVYIMTNYSSFSELDYDPRNQESYSAYEISN
jgi:hypothetical protein